MMRTVKSLFTERNCYTKEAHELDGKVSRFAYDIFEEYVEKGYDIRQIAYAMINAIKASEAENILIEQVKWAKENRKKCETCGKQIYLQEEGDKCFSIYEDCNDLEPAYYLCDMCNYKRMYGDDNG
jgi:hypothetical protein